MNANSEATPRLKLDDKSILLVEDEEAHAELVRRAFEKHATGFRLVVASSLREARCLLAEGVPALVISDWQLPDGQGLELLPADAENMPFPFLLMTSHGNEQIVVEALKAGAVDYVVKSDAAFLALPRTAALALREWKHREARHRAEAELHEKTAALENAVEGISRLNRQGIYLEVNPAYARMLGYAPTELVGQHWEITVHPDHREFVQRTVQDMLAEGKAKAEFRGLRKDWSVFFMHIVLVLAHDTQGQANGHYCFMRDITERKEAEETIKASLHEKETLLKEIHHRVKNNLQVISSLLHLQTGYVTDPALLAVFEEAQGRVRAMTLIHERLYRSDNLSNIEMGGYLRELATMLLRTYGRSETPVELQMRIAAIPLNVDTAIPVGLIANELVSNSLKHAFRGSRRGTLTVELQGDKSTGLLLVVRDNGVGLPPNFSPDSHKSLGLRLVKMLTEQVHATLEWQSQDGAEFRLNFQELHYKC